MIRGLMTIGIVALAALLGGAGQGPAEAVSPPATVQEPSDGMASPPPVPTLELSGEGMIVETVFERWTRPRPDGEGFSAAFPEPSPNSTLPVFRAVEGCNVLVNTGLAASSVDVDVLSERSSRTTSLRVTKLEAQQWQFRMPGRRAVIVRVDTSYADGGDSRARAELRGRSRSADRDLAGERVPVQPDQLRLYEEPNRSFIGNLRKGQTFKVRKLSASGKYAYGFAYGRVNKVGWVLTEGFWADCR